MIVDIYIIFFFFNDTATTEIYTLSLHDALPISVEVGLPLVEHVQVPLAVRRLARPRRAAEHALPVVRRLAPARPRSEEHTSELQSRQYLVCRLLLEKKKKKPQYH